MLPYAYCVCYGGHSQERPCGMPAARLLVAELGLVTAAEAALELAPVPASDPVPAGLLPNDPP